MKGKSSRAERGLFQRKRIRSGYRRTFSEKHILRSFKPNVCVKHLHSDILNKRFKLEVTTTALKTIRKMDGLDNYLLKSKEKTIDSKRGLMIKEAIQMRQKDPNSYIYIPKTAKVRKRRATKDFEYRLN
jgi:large subunit ribosomal protein L28